jgi:hypothetical protein
MVDRATREKAFLDGIEIRETQRVTCELRTFSERERAYLLECNPTLELTDIKLGAWSFDEEDGRIYISTHVHFPFYMKPGGDSASNFGELVREWVRYLSASRKVAADEQKAWFDRLPDDEFKADWLKRNTLG